MSTSITTGQVLLRQAYADAGAATNTKRVLIQGKYFHLIIREGGSFRNLKDLNEEQLNQISVMGTAILKAHQTSASSSLAQREIDYIDDLGIHYKKEGTEAEAPVSQHNTVKPEPYALNELTKQQEEEVDQLLSSYKKVDHLSDLEIPHMTLIAELGSDHVIFNQLGQQATYKKDVVLKELKRPIFEKMMARGQILNNDLSATEQDEFKQKLSEKLEALQESDNPETAIQELNSYIKSSITAQSLWNKLRFTLGEPSVIMSTPQFILEPRNPVEASGATSLEYESGDAFVTANNISDDEEFDSLSTLSSEEEIDSFSSDDEDESSLEKNPLLKSNFSLIQTADPNDKDSIFSQTLYLKDESNATTGHHLSSKERTELTGEMDFDFISLINTDDEQEILKLNDEERQENPFSLSQQDQEGEVFNFSSTSTAERLTSLDNSHSSTVIPLISHPSFQERSSSYITKLPSNFSSNQQRAKVRGDFFHHLEVTAKSKAIEAEKEEFTINEANRKIAKEVLIKLEEGEFTQNEWVFIHNFISSIQKPIQNYASLNGEQRFNHFVSMLKKVSKNS